MTLRVFAPAKINLWLSVGARRSDGLHAIVSVVQAVSLGDDLTFEPATQTSLEVEPPGSAPEDASNLVVRAAQAMMAATGGGGARMRLRKRVPSGAGLGGGSADAAAALVGLNELWRAGISRKALERTGAALGADVPFCVRGGTAMVRGAGEDLTPLASPNALWWVLASDGTSLSTAAVYAERDRIGTGALQDPSELADALARTDLDAIAANLRNDLQEPAIALAPSIAAAGDALRAAGAIGVVMSGSGSAWAGLARHEAHARDVASRLEGAVAWCAVVSSIAHGPRIDPAYDASSETPWGIG